MMAGLSKRTLGTAFALWTLLPATLSASPADQFGLGARSQALAGTGASHHVGVATTYNNPALLSWDPSRRLGLGLHAANYQLNATGTPAGTLDDATQALQFGATTPLPFPEPIADRLVLGLSFSTAGEHIARVRILQETAPQFPMLGRRAESLNFSLGLGVQVTDAVSLGVGTAVLAGLRGQVTIDAGGGSGATENVTDTELVITTAPTFGAGLKLTEAWRVGAVWRDELRASFDLVVRVQDLGTVVLPPLNVNGLTQIDPEQLTIESSYQLEQWLLVAGLTFKRWSQVGRFREATVRCPEEQPDCAALGPVTIPMDDTWVPRLAVEYRTALTRHSEVAARAGYFYEMTPLPAQTGAHRVFDNARHVVTAGYGLQLNAPLPELSVHLAAQVHQLADRKHEVEPEPVTSSGRVLSFGLTVEAGF